MKVFLVFVLLLLTTLSCDWNIQSLNKEQIQERLLSGEFDAYSYLPTINCDSLATDDSGNILYEDSLFSGVCVMYYPNGESVLEARQIFRGKLHGNRILFSPKGDTLSMNLYNHGRLLRESIGQNEVVHCDSLEVFRNDSGDEIRYYFGEPYNGFCETYYPDDSTAIYTKASYSKGLKHGDFLVYDRSGEIILKEYYQAGEFVKR